MSFGNVYLYEAPREQTNGVWHDSTAVHKICLKQTKRALIDHGVQEDRIYTIRSFAQIPESKGALVIPGGDALVARESIIKDKGIEKIQSLVAGGMSFLGFCSGAFLGSKDIIFSDKSRFSGIFSKEPHPLIDSRLLDLISALADASIFHNNGKSAFGPFGGIVKAIDADSEQAFYQYWNGGCAFQLDSEDHVKVLARYENGQPAAISAAYGQGTVCLIGGHPEEDGSQLPPIISDLELLQQSDAQRNCFMKKVFQTVHILPEE